MENTNYKINRDDIYVGIISSTDFNNIRFYQNLYDFELASKKAIYEEFDNQKHMLERKSHIWYDFPQGERVILFVLAENKCANDLLYDSPHYPIFNISSDDLCSKATISIKNHVYSIGKILKHYGYNEFLEYKDICKIKEQFFGDFVLDNCELFGLCETDPNQSGNETYDLNGNHRTFNETKEKSVFPKCYFQMFWRTRNLKSPYDEYIDRFIPSKIEGPIKKLKI